MIFADITIGSVDTCTFQWMLYFWIEDPFYIIMEYVAGGNMQQYLRKFRPSQQATNSEELVPPTAKDLKSFALQISRGMEHLSSLNVSSVYYTCITYFMSIERMLFYTFWVIVKKSLVQLADKLKLSFFLYR